MQEFSISQNDAQQRLDKFLKKLFPGATLSFLYKLNRTDKIKIITREGKKTKQDNEYKLSVGEKVQVYLGTEDFEVFGAEKSQTQLLSEKQKFSRADIVFEDQHILVINKSAGINVHPGDHKSEEVSLIEQVQDYFGARLSSLTFKPSLVHRIDRDTSGVVVVAKDKESLTKLAFDFGEKLRLKKVYLAIVFGKLSRPSGTIKKNLKRIENARNENKVQVSESGQEATTHYKLLEEFELSLPEGKEYVSVLEVQIETGRMHQIRVHLAHIGNPVIGDKTYGNPKLNTYFAKKYAVMRHMLHSWKLTLTHPKTAKIMTLEAKWKRDMEDFILKLRKE